MKSALMMMIFVIIMGACSEEFKAEESVGGKLSAEVSSDTGHQASDGKSILFFASDTLALLKEAKGGDVEAQFHLGITYYEIKEFEKAKLWFDEAINQNYKPAKKYFALLLSDGIYSFRDRDKANELYESLGQEGDMESCRILAEQAYIMDEKLKWYRLMIEQGDVEAINIVAGYYMSQLKVLEAVDLYNKAVLLGDWDAVEKLIRAYDFLNRDADAYAWALLLNLRGDSLMKWQLFSSMNTKDIIEAQKKCEELATQFLD